MHLYTISEHYLNYLRTVDGKVPNSHGDHYSVKKPYLGVVLTVDGHDFLAPLSSPKEWHDNVKTSEITIFKLHERTNVHNKLGIIALKFMVPTQPSVIAELDLTDRDQSYQALVNSQYEYIKTKWGKIQNKAEKLYDHVVVNPKPYLQGTTCDFAKLIQHSKFYCP